MPDIIVASRYCFSRTAAMIISDASIESCCKVEKKPTGMLLIGFLIQCGIEPFCLFAHGQLIPRYIDALRV